MATGTADSVGSARPAVHWATSEALAAGVRWPQLLGRCTVARWRSRAEALCCATADKAYRQGRPPTSVSVHIPFMDLRQAHAQQISICAAKASESRCVQCAGSEVAEFHRWHPERTGALIWSLERSRSCRIVAATPTRHEVLSGLRRLKRACSALRSLQHTRFLRRRTTFGRRRC